METNNLNAVRALLSQALYLLNAAESDDGGGGTNNCATVPGQAAVALNNIGGGPAGEYTADPVHKHSLIERRINPKWSAAELAVLRSGMSTAEVAAATGRTRGAVRYKRRHMIDPEVRAASSAHARALTVRGKFATTPAPASGKPWTPEETALLNRRDLTDTDIALQLGRSYVAVYNRRYNLRTKQIGGAA